MKTPNKPRICIALPGINYLPYSPYVLSTLPMVPYLEQDFEITLVYRKIVEPHQPDHAYLTILDPTQFSEKEKQNQHGYFAPSNYINGWKYRQALHQFAQANANRFDLVIEKEWPFLGALAHAFRQYKVPTAIIAEAEYQFKKPAAPVKSGNGAKAVAQKLLSVGLDQLRPHLRKRWSQEAQSLIVETEQMKSFLLGRGYRTPADAIYPIPYGIDTQIFYPRDRDRCRQQLGIDPDALVLTYVGSLNRFIQEPGPLLEALGREKPQGVVLHMVGDGTKRHELEAIAQRFEAPVVFHGRLPQQQAALYMGAANLCIAPYNKSLYPNQTFTCASLKVPEYMACGRPVLTIPCQRMSHLLDRGRYGFLVENEVRAYREFFANMLKINQISEMEDLILADLENSTLTAKEIVLTWQDVADRYKQVFDRSLSGSHSFQAAPRVRSQLVANH